MVVPSQGVQDSHTDNFYVGVACASCRGARDEGRQPATPTGRTEEQTSTAKYLSLHHTETGRLMISTTCSTTEMVTQAKLQINDSENIEGETFNNPLSFSVDILVWTTCLSKASTQK